MERVERAIVTGASGFVGSVLCQRLEAPRALHLGAPGWREALGATEFDSAVVFHLAARVHRPDRGGDDAAYRADNVEKTLALAQAAARGGARAFVFASTVKVNGEETRGKAFTERDVPAPQDAYARSKLEAERELGRLGRESSMRVSIVRLPLVYGATVKGNLGALARLCDSAWPLPFAAIDNRRSFLHVDDAAALLEACALRAPPGVNVYMAAHATPASTPALVRAMREALGRPARLFPMPGRWLEAAAGIVGQGAKARRLTRSLEVDASEAERSLGWRAGESLARCVRDVAGAYRAGRPA